MSSNLKKNNDLHLPGRCVGYMSSSTRAGRECTGDSIRARSLSRVHLFNRAPHTPQTQPRNNYTQAFIQVHDSLNKSTGQEETQNPRRPDSMAQFPRSPPPERAPEPPVDPPRKGRGTTAP